MRWIIFIVLTIFLISDVLALVGVTPAISEVNFKPGLKQTFLFDFFSDGDSAFDIYVEGDLAKYVTLDKKRINGGGRVAVLLELPNEIELPGEHRLLVGARQVADKNAGVALTANIRAVIKVIVPYPGKYAEMQFSVSNANTNEDIEFSISVINKGRENLDSNIFVETYVGKKKLDTIDFGNFLINTEETLHISQNFSTSGYKPGDYNAIAYVDYKEKQIKSEDNFRLGELLIKIINSTVNFKEARINPLVVVIESFWNDPLDNVYANITILNSNISFLTPSIRLEPWQQSSLVGYFDTSELVKSSFKTNIQVIYANKTTEKTFNMKIVKESEGINLVLVILISLIVILVLALLLLTIWVNKLAKKINPKKR